VSLVLADIATAMSGCVGRDSGIAAVFDHTVAARKNLHNHVHTPNLYLRKQHAATVRSASATAVCGTAMWPTTGCRHIEKVSNKLQQQYHPNTLREVCAGACHHNGDIPLRSVLYAL
jgi:hypothetical protein